MRSNDDAIRERLKAEDVENVHHFYSREYLNYPSTCIGAGGYPPDFFAHRFWLLNVEVGCGNVGSMSSFVCSQYFKHFWVLFAGHTHEMESY